MSIGAPRALPQKMSVPDPSTSRHLVQPPRYQSPDGRWWQTFDAALAHCPTELVWDPAALLSVSMFNYACADRTLIGEIKRQPWLSRVPAVGPAEYTSVIPHNRRWMDQERIANELYSRLATELTSACRDRRRVYLLLSGGMDSRIVAGAIADLHRRGELANLPVAVTWGLEDSRDVVYAREIAKRLGFEWIHVSLGPDDLFENIEATAAYLGAMIPPNLLHRVTWFRHVESDAIVLAASYGDMVGRGEFSGRTVLELESHAVRDVYCLLHRDFSTEGRREFSLDVEALRQRCPRDHEYVSCELEQHNFYTRGALNQAMSVIGRFCGIYQAFTDPEVYGFMWSLHPALRTDEPYARLLERYDPYLARLPWARTNRALAGATSGRQRQRNSYHDYEAWIRGPLYPRLRQLVDPKWFGATGLFEGASVARLDEHLRAGAAPPGGFASGVAWNFLWLASVRRFVELAAESGHRVVPPRVSGINEPVAAISPPTKSGFLRRWVRNKPAIRRWLKRMRVARLRHDSIRRYPPTSNEVA